MTDLIVPEPLAAQVRQLAAQAGLTTEAVLTTAVQHYAAEARAAKLHAEAAWWRAAPAELRAQYLGEFVAVHQRRVVDHDSNRMALYRRVHQQLGETVFLLTSSEDPPLIRVISTRLEIP